MKCRPISDPDSYTLREDDDFNEPGMNSQFRWHWNFITRLSKTTEENDYCSGLKRWSKQIIKTSNIELSSLLEIIL